MTTIPPRPEGLRTVRLTRRETEILGLAAQGHTSQEIADRLYLSTRTVGFHLANVYEKLEVSNRVQAFRVAARLDLIADKSPFFPHMAA